MRKRIAMILTLVLGFLSNAQVSGALSRFDGEVKGSVSTITSWVTGVFGLVALIRLIIIFTSQGSGEEKIGKAGLWIFMLIFCALGFALSKGLFTTS